MDSRYLQSINANLYNQIHMLSGCTDYVISIKNNSLRKIRESFFYIFINHIYDKHSDVSILNQFDDFFGGSVGKDIFEQNKYHKTRVTNKLASLITDYRVNYKSLKDYKPYAQDLIENYSLEYDSLCEQADLVSGGDLDDSPDIGIIGKCYNHFSNPTWMKFFFLKDELERDNNLFETISLKFKLMMLPVNSGERRLLEDSRIELKKLSNSEFWQDKHIDLKVFVTEYLKVEERKTAINKEKNLLIQSISKHEQLMDAIDRAKADLDNAETFDEEEQLEARIHKMNSKEIFSFVEFLANRDVDYPALAMCYFHSTLIKIALNLVIKIDAISLKLSLLNNLVDDIRNSHNKLSFLGLESTLSYEDVSDMDNVIIELSLYLKNLSKTIPKMYNEKTIKEKLFKMSLLSSNLSDKEVLCLLREVSLDFGVIDFASFDDNSDKDTFVQSYIKKIEHHLSNISKMTLQIMNEVTE